MGRYSQSKLGLPAKTLAMNRALIKPTFAKVNDDVIRSTVATSSLKDDTSMLLEEIEVCNETIHKSYNVDKNRQYFEKEKKVRHREVEEVEKGYS
jgi:hypothetical protein